MKISIFGMGYVGAVCAACLADRGHYIVGADVSELKVNMIRDGRSPIVEPGLGELLKKGVAAGLIHATTQAHEAVRDTDISMICVGTPSRKNGDLDLHYIETVAQEIGAAIRHKATRHTVVVRSTVLPGTVRNVIVPLLEQASGKRVGIDFGMAVNPEFLRESTAIDDYNKPPMTVVGEWDDESGATVAALYTDLPAKVFRRPIEVAEMVKYTCNVWHATKVTFANEIGNIAKLLGVDGREVMNVVCHDQKLNVSNYYMKPGFAFGGSCLPKDLRALTFRASRLDAEQPLLSSLMRSNGNQIQRAFDLVASFDKRRIGFLGLSFKADTDDLRESPLVELAEMLIGKGYQLSIFDRNVDYARINGTNKEYINFKIPHVSTLLKSDIDEVLDASDVMVLGHKDKVFESVLNGRGAGKKVVDLVGLMQRTSTAEHQGICW